MFGDDVADVVDDNVLLVPLLQLLEEPAGSGNEASAAGQEVTLGRPGVVYGRAGGGGGVETRG